MPTTKTAKGTYETVVYTVLEDGTRELLILEHELDGKLLSQRKEITTKPIRTTKPIDFTGASPFNTFIDSIPCFYDGCAELRAEYKARLAAEKKCPPCKQGQIIRELLPRAEALIKLHNEKKQNAQGDTQSTT